MTMGRQMKRVLNLCLIGMLFAACATTDDDTIVPIAVPCIAGNSAYEVGESYDQDCNICTCQADGSFSLHRDGLRGDLLVPGD